ncbi:MAG: V-type ATP synthase subunit F [Clostridia bacterium]|nr:V-type ATP synthase subunit F [Clostridia bacterium]
MKGETAIIGYGSGVLAFKAAGVDAYTAIDSTRARELLRKLAKTYKVIFITDDLARDLNDLIERMNEKPYPIILPIPSEKGSSGYATERMKDQMERALGVDILFSREEKPDARKNS